MVTILKGTIAVLAIAIVLGLSPWSANQAAAQINVTVDKLLAGSITDATPQQYPDVAEAITRFNNRDVAGARDLLETAKKKDPRLPPPEVILATMYASIGQVGPLRGELEQAVVKRPDDPEAYLIIADLAAQDRRIAEADALYTKARALIDTYSENPKRKRNFEMRVDAGLAGVAEAREQWDGAIKQLQAWLQADPESVVAHQRLGRAYFKQGSERDAYKEYQAAAKVDAKSMNPDIAMARMYEEAKNRDKALQFVNYAVKTNPKDLMVQLAASDWALNTSQLKDAEKYADAALAVDPKSIDALLLRGRLARLNGDFTKAESMFEQAHLLGPGNFNASNQLALALADQSDTRKQQRALELAELNARATMTQNRINPEAFATLGWVLYRLGRTNDAEQALNRVLQTGSLSPDSAYYVAKVLVDRGRNDDAAKLLDGALKTPIPFVQREASQKLLNEINAKGGGAAPAGPPIQTDPLAPATGEK